MRDQPKPQVAITVPRARGVRLTRAVLRGLLAAGARETTWGRAGRVRVGRLRQLGRLRASWRPGRLLVDYDGAPPPDRVLAGRLRAAGVHPVACGWSRSASGRGWHLVVELREPLGLVECIALQAILGSDPFREAFTLARARSGPRGRWRAESNILFDAKWRL